MFGLSIGEVARQAGLRPSAVRYYERRGLLPVPKRVNGRRRYSPTIVQRLTIIQFAQQAGFTLEEIRSLFRIQEAVGLDAEHWRQAAHQKLAQLDAWIEQLQRMKGMLERGSMCACRQIEECVIIDRTWWGAQSHPVRGCSRPATAPCPE
jgi:MerR family redox-sensitive transcriptional activator SoxR